MDQAIEAAMDRLFGALYRHELDRDALAEGLRLAGARPLNALRPTMALLGRDPAAAREQWRHPKGTLIRLRAVPDPVPPLLRAEPALARVLICSRRGFTREAALHALPPPEDAFQLASLLMRLDDWVPEVRTLAEHQFQRVMARIPPHVVAEVALSLLPRVEAMWRLSERGRQLWQALLTRDDEMRGALVAGLMRGQGGAARLAFLRLMRDPLLDEALPMLARRASHPSIRKTAFGWQMEGAVAFDGLLPGYGPRRFGPVRRPLTIEVDREALMRALATDPAVPVRKTVADLLPRLADTAPEAARRLAVQMTWDRHPGVKARAEWYHKNRATA